MLHPLVAPGVPPPPPASPSTVASGCYIELVRTAVKKAGLFFAEKAVPEPIAKVASGLMRRPLMKLAAKTTRETLEELTRTLPCSESVLDTTPTLCGGGEIPSHCGESPIGEVACPPLPGDCPLVSVWLGEVPADLLTSQRPNVFVSLEECQASATSRPPIWLR